MERNAPLFVTPEHMLETQRTNVSAAISLSQTLFSAMEKLVDLNLKVVRATLDEVSTRSHQALDLKDVREAVSFNSQNAQPAAEKALAYTRHLYDIMSTASAEVLKLGESQVNERQRKVSDFIEQVSRNAPAGSESAVAMMKTSFAAATSAYDTFSKAANQLSEMTKSNLNAAADASFKASNGNNNAANDASKNQGGRNNNVGQNNANNQPGKKVA